MTVSNVLNYREHKVSPQTRDKVLKIVNKYNYSLNMNASNLRGNSSRLIGLLYYTKNIHFDFTDPFVVAVLAGIEERAKEEGYFVLVHAITETEDLINLQDNWKFAGFIVISVESASFTLFDGCIDLPTCYIDTYLTDEQLSLVNKNRFFIHTDDFELGRSAGIFLKQLKHQKLGVLTFNHDQAAPSVVEKRIKGFADIFGDNFPIFKIDDYAKFTSYNLLVEDIIKSKVTAIFATSDMLAINLLHYLNNSSSLSVIGVDDIPLSKYVSPSLTTIKIDQKEKGKLSFNRLIEIIDHDSEEHLSMSNEMKLGFNLIKRNSAHDNTNF